MKRENAHQYLKKVYLTTKTDSYREALSVALSALRPVSREQVEKVWRGEWKPIERLWKYSHQWQCSRCGQPTLTDQKQFCDSCGAPMTDEAVDIIMRRLETLYETT